MAYKIKHCQCLRYRPLQFHLFFVPTGITILGPSFFCCSLQTFHTALPHEIGPLWVSELDTDGVNTPAVCFVKRKLGLQTILHSSFFLGCALVTWGRLEAWKQGEGRATILQVLGIPTPHTLTLVGSSSNDFFDVCGCFPHSPNQPHYKPSGSQCSRPATSSEDLGPCLQSFIFSGCWIGLLQLCSLGSVPRCPAVAQVLFGHSNTVAPQKYYPKREVEATTSSVLSPETGFIFTYFPKHIQVFFFFFQMYIASFYAQKLAPLLEDSFGQGQSLRALCPTPAPLWLSAWPPSILSYSKSALLSSNPALQGLTPAPPPSWLPSASLPSGLPSGLYHLLFRKWP